MALALLTIFMKHQFWDCSIIPLIGMKLKLRLNAEYDKDEKHVYPTQF